MKRIIYLCLLMFCFLGGSAQYIVTKVVGNVVNVVSNDKIVLGSKLNDNDALSWVKPVLPNAMVRALVAGKGVYIITPSPMAKQNPNEVVEYVKKSLKIKAKEGYLSGRAENDELIPGSLETEFTISNSVLISKLNQYLIDKKEYDVSDGSRFFLQINSVDFKPVIRQLTTISDTLLIKASDFILPPDQKNSPVKYQLGFFSKAKSATRSLIAIKPFLDTTNQMETIIQMVIANSKQIDKKKLKQECYAEVYAALGKPADITFNKAFLEMISEASKAKISPRKKQ